VGWQDVTQAGLVQNVAYILLLLSAHRDFAVALNLPADARR
jgi:hypothetical protein